MASWGGSGSGIGSGGSLREIFEKALPGHPTVIDSTSTKWRKKQPEHEPCTELFGELHFREPIYEFSSSSSLSPRPSGSPPNSKDVNLHSAIEKLDDDDKNNENEMKASSDSLFGVQKNQYMKSFKSTGTGFSSKNAESLQLCTEGLGFESSDDVENSKDETRDDWKNIQKGEMSITRNNSSASHKLNESRRLRTMAGDFPPPITCLGKNGKPLVTLKAFRYNGRFILKGIKIPNREILHACREDGRLTLHRVQHDEEILEEVEYDDAYEQEYEEEADYVDAYEQEDKGDGKKSEFSNVEVQHNP